MRLNRGDSFRIGSDLTSIELERVKDGLSNVLYWGYAQMGIRDIRVQRFRSKVSVDQLQRASELFRRSLPPSVVEIKKLGLPEFSGLSFVSKVRMFLDPDKSAVLDWQIVKIHNHRSTTLLANLHIGKSTKIPITQHNSEVYELGVLGRPKSDGLKRRERQRRKLFETIELPRRVEQPTNGT